MRSDRYKDNGIEQDGPEENSAETTEKENTEEAAEKPAEESVAPQKLESEAIVEEAAPKKRFGRSKKDRANATETETDLSKLKKKDLLGIMLAQSKEIDSLRAQVAELESKLADREFEFNKIGSIAEASLAVTNIFKEAEEAAKIYLYNIRRRCDERTNEHGDK